ncbi:complex I subunit 1 family protein [Planctomycetota bacterium]
MTIVLHNLFSSLIFPGFLFTLIVGLFASWLVRKVGALVQYRVGPPVLQPLYDVGKLLGKEILIPQEAQKAVFIGAPLVGFAAVMLLTTLLWRTALDQAPFMGDSIVVIYMMVIPSLALILGGSASASPHAALGASREMKLVLAYELPLVLAFIVVLIKTTGADGSVSLSLATIAQHTSALSISGMLAFLVALLCIHAKLGYVPFDMAESETEIASGLIMEYSGALLAVWKLMHMLMLVVLPLYLILMFLGGFGTSGGALAAGIGKFVLIWVLMILIKNTNPRVRIDQAMRFFWCTCGSLMIVAVVLATVGRVTGLTWL